MLFFLHGFLGQKEDWNSVRENLPFSSIALDLPGHGVSKKVEKDIALQIKKQVPRAEYLIGYSAGGRIGIELKHRFPKDYQNLILISTHVQILSKEERISRLQQDQKWLELLQNSSLEMFLQNWYLQDLFQPFRKKPVFASTLERRKKQNPMLLFQFYEQYNVATAASFPIPKNSILIYGEEDLKYGNLYRTLPIPDPCKKVYAVENSGHVIPLENPMGLAKVIQEVVYDNNTNSP